MTNVMRTLVMALLAALGSGCGFDVDIIKDGTSVDFDDGVVDLNDFVDEGSSCVAKTAGERELDGYKLTSYRVTGLREGRAGPAACAEAERAA